MSLLLLPSLALAQDPEAAAETAETSEAKPEHVVGGAADAVGVPEAPKQKADELGEAAAEPGKTGKFMDNFHYQALVSGYYMFNAHRVGGVYNVLGYPYSNEQGFGLNFAGGDMEYMAEKWGIRIDLRWGTGADQLTSIAPVKQGYVRWIPCERLTLDMGFWDTVFGAEVVDEWENVNYTRGALYFNLQPFNHLGLRAGIEITEELGVTVLVANGGVFGGRVSTQEQQANIQAPAVGAQVGWSPTKGDHDFGLFVGAMGGPNGTNGNKDWETFIDAVFSWSYKDLSVIANGDIVLSPNGPTTGTQFEQLYGWSAAIQYAFHEHWAAGLRGEGLYADRDGNATGGRPTLHTLTGTIRYIPVEYLVISLEPRADFSESSAFFARPFTTDVDGNSVATANKEWFFGFWIGATAHFGN